ncbi:MAG: 50S ribosomal protein L25/general stress protein Ctc [Pseudomonadota bacterium]
MADVLDLNAAARDRVGKGAARAIRRDGRVPGVIYGDKKPPQAVTLDSLEVWKQHQTGNFLATVYNVMVDGQRNQVIPKNVQLHPVSDQIIHVDFLRVAADAEVTVEVSVTFINEDECPGLTRGGVLNVVRFAIEVNCPALAIPDEFVVDLTGREIGDSINISDVTLPEKVTPVIDDRDFTIATIAAPTVEAEPSEDDDAEAAEGADAAEGGGDKGDSASD